MRLARACRRSPDFAISPNSSLLEENGGSRRAWRPAVHHRRNDKSDLRVFGPEVFTGVWGGRKANLPKNSRTSSANGLVRNSRAPAFIARTVIGTSPWPVMKMIGMTIRSPAMRFCKSRPLRSGRPTSRIRQLGTKVRGRERNSCADANVSGCQPSRRRLFYLASRPAGLMRQTLVLISPQTTTAPPHADPSAKAATRAPPP